MILILTRMILKGLMIYVLINQKILMVSKMTDGCPDLDNDADGILDVNDKCPNEAEDFDGFEDADGCPDLDNDADGILDINDKCPNEAEDFDGFEDEDGCPEATSELFKEDKFFLVS